MKIDYLSLHGVLVRSQQCPIATVGRLEQADKETCLPHPIGGLKPCLKSERPAFLSGPDLTNSTAAKHHTTA